MHKQRHDLLYLEDIVFDKLNNCTHVTYNGKNKYCFLQHADTKQQILDTRYDSNNDAWCVYYNGEDRFGGAAALTTVKPTKTTTESAVSKPKFTFEKGCEYENYDLSNIKNIPSHAMCANQCQINKRCTHATYYFNNQVCFLQRASSKALIQETRSKAINSWCILYNDEDRYEPAVGMAVNESRIVFVPDPEHKRQTPSFGHINKNVNKKKTTKRVKTSKSESAQKNKVKRKEI
uniref:Apple domain-containing protein n=1 Tax=Romanomermis culicivorax TaxID=13658 RepID=A0A915IRJ6_ROMCU